MSVHLKATVFHAFIWKCIYSNTSPRVSIYCLYYIQKYLLSTFQHNSSITHTVPLHYRGDELHHTHKILFKDRATEFINELWCHLQKLEWRIETFLQMVRVENPGCQGRIGFRRLHPERSLLWAWVAPHCGPNITTLVRPKNADQSAQRLTP
jgi:hypothetical protein